MNTYNLYNLLKEIKYNEDDGSFHWVNSKKGRPTDRPAGHFSHQGYLQITFNGEKFHGPKLAWFMATGEWPDFLIGYKDGDSRNLAWENLKRIEHEDRVEHFKKVGDELDNRIKKVHNNKPLKRATFTNHQANEATEEFIKNKTLINGVYV